MNIAANLASSLRALTLVVAATASVAALAGAGDTITPTPFVDLSRAKETGYLSYSNTIVNAVTADPKGAWLDATFTGKYSNVAKTFTTPVDYTAFNGYTLALKNYENRRVRVNIRFDTTTNNASSGAYSMYVWLPAKETILAVFENGAADPTSKGMLTEPPIGTSDLPIIRMRLPAFSLKTVYKFQVYNGDTTSQRVAIARLGGIKYTQQWSNILDSYGQFTGRSWAGKIATDADLANAATDEAADLLQHPPVSSLNGIVDSTQTATGKWGVYKSAAGNWFFRTPAGNRFWSVGLHGIRGYEPTPTLNRDDLLNLPSLATAAGQFLGLDDDGVMCFDYFKANLVRKYGSDWQNAWSDRMNDRLKSWGFNTVGASSDGSVSRQGMPHFELLSTEGYQYTLSNRGTSIPDPYDVSFCNYLVTKWKGEYLADSLRNDPNLIGVFVDNELAWGYIGVSGTYWDKYALVSKIVACGPTEPAKIQWVNMVKGNYGGSLSRFNSLYGKSFLTWAEVLLPWDVTTVDTTNYYVNRDVSNMLKDFIGAYAWRVRDAVRMVFPTALYGGSRNQPTLTPSEVFSEMDRSVDFNAINLYGDERTIDWSFFSTLTKPVVISEFGFVTQGNGNSDEDGADDMSTTSATPAQTTDRLTRYMNHALSIPNIIGLQLYKGLDHPFIGTSDTMQTSSIGILSTTDAPKPEVVSAFRTLANVIYSARP